MSVRCHAKSKRTRQQCKATAVEGWKVCRHHGAGGGAPKGKRNGNYKSGHYTQEAINERKAIGELIRMARELALISPH
jgi:hypothetical protein